MDLDFVVTSVGHGVAYIRKLIQRDPI